MIILNKLDEIRNYFAHIHAGKMILLKSYGKDFPSWVLRDYGKFGVAVEVGKDIQVNERFSNARFYTQSVPVGDEEKTFLCLTSGSEELRYEFASICAIFLDPGVDGADRKKLQDTPLKWWESYKELVGNRTVSIEPYSLLGEMIAFYWLYQQDEHAIWSGPNKASVDIESEKGLFEVKSTLLRTDNMVQISNQFQLNASRQQSLIFCRFEEVMQGLSINDLAEKIVKAGYSEFKIEEKLSGMGFEKNSSARERKYELHEIREYEINEDFPLIDFKKDVPAKFADHIIKIMYKVDLKGIKSENIDTAFLK